MVFVPVALDDDAAGNKKLSATLFPEIAEGPSLRASTQKFWSKMSSENKPTILDQRVFARNFWRTHNFGYNFSTCQKFRSGALALIENFGPIFGTHFWPKFLSGRLQRKGLTSRLEGPYSKFLSGRTRNRCQLRTCLHARDIIIRLWCAELHNDAARAKMLLATVSGGIAEESRVRTLQSGC